MNATLRIGSVLTLAATLGACSGINLDPLEQTPAPVQSVDAKVSDENPYACELITIELGTTDHTPLTSLPTPGVNGEAAAAACRLTGDDCGKVGIRGQYQADTVTGAQTETIQGDLVCEPRCTVDADCPAADSGTSTPLCWIPESGTQGLCYLPCDGAQACPVGFECHAADDASGRPSRCTQPISATYTFTYPPESAP